MRFNPRSRVGSDELTHAAQPRLTVSIRAPAWGATPGLADVGDAQDVSIRAPAWGATFDLHVEGAVAGVSIRAPAWGATRHHCAHARELVFQSALPRGERPTFSALMPAWLLFQSALPRGERRFGFGFGLREGDVSIRAPAWGATRETHPGDRGGDVSIRAPAWGATSRPRHLVRVPHRFNPRSRVGSDGGRASSISDAARFNPRSRVGSDAARAWIARC